MSQAPLVPPEALKGKRVGISVSESVDLARLGLMETHFQLALGEIARCVLVAGGQLAYGGTLRVDGYTIFLMQEVRRFSRRDQPLHVYLSWPEHRRLSLSSLAEQKDELGLFGTFTFLDGNGNDVDEKAGRSDAPAPETDQALEADAYTGLRRRMAAETDARALIGGKRTGYRGRMPGIIEEAIFALDRRQPLYLAGGFGGVTLDVIGALGIDDASWLPPSSQLQSADEGLKAGLAEVAAAAASRVDNGLSDDENRLLARSYRPSEIATLIGLGLGRLAGAIPG